VKFGPIQVAVQVADALEACGLLYLVGGSVASSIGGEPRTTLDVDMVVAMAETDVNRFLAALGSEFYADDVAIRRAIRQHSSVNLIHQPSAIEVDLFIAGGSPLGWGLTALWRSIPLLGPFGARGMISDVVDQGIEMTRTDDRLRGRPHRAIWPR